MDRPIGKLENCVELCFGPPRPLDLLLLRAGANLEIYSANTKLEGVLAYGFGKKIMVRDLNGQIAPETLKSLANWQWPSNAIQLQEIDFNYKKEQGFDQVDGEYNGQAANSCTSLRSAHNKCRFHRWRVVCRRSKIS